MRKNLSFQKYYKTAEIVTALNSHGRKKKRQREIKGDQPVYVQLTI